jgi:hypothetical protein
MSTKTEVTTPKPLPFGKVDDTDVSIQEGGNETLSMGGDGALSVTQDDEDTLYDSDSAPLQDDNEGDNEDTSTDDEKPDDKGEATDTKVSEDEVAPPDLGDFDHAKNKKEFDARYNTNTGMLNMEVLEAEVIANGSKADGSFVLNENTAKYLETTRGISKEDAHFFIQQRMAEGQKAWTGFVESVGGETVLKDAQAWAATNYTKEQKDKFNALLKGKDQNALTTELELLVGRYQRSNPQAKTPEAKETAKAKNFAERTPTSTAKTSDVEGYKDRQEERKEASRINRIDDADKRAKAQALHFKRVKASAHFQKEA